MSALSLFDALAVAPALPGAKCRGRHHLFDEPERDADPDDAEYQQQAALRLCSHCPSLVRCAEWVDSLPPSKRPPGVVGGRVRRTKPAGRPRKSA